MAVPALRQKVDFICILNGAADTNFSVTAWRRFIYFVFMLYIDIGHVGLHLSFAYLKKGEGSRGTPPRSFSLRKIQFCTVTENSFRPPPPHPTPPDNQNYPLGPPSLGKLICMVNWHSNTCRSWSIRYTPILDITNLSKPFNRCVL